MLRSFPLRQAFALKPLLLSFLAVFAWSVPVSAADEDPAPALLATINSVVDLALGQSPAVIDQRLGDIRSKMSGSFAIEVIVQRAFGRNWSKLTPAQQTEAIDLLGRLIIRTYAVQLSTGERPTIQITGSREIGADRREILSTVTQAGQLVNVVYRLGKIDGKWKVYDVLGEGVSVVGNYRQQFDAHFEKKNAADLLALLKAKLAAPPAPDAPVAGPAPSSP